MKNIGKLVATLAALGAASQAHAGRGIDLLQGEVFTSRGECTRALNMARNRGYAEGQFGDLTRASVHWYVAKSYHCVELASHTWIVVEETYSKPN